jgi:WD40 repeat protein
MNTPKSPSFFNISGTLWADDPSYIIREADSVLSSSLLNAEYCYVLVGRQMGKSSLMVRSRKQLQEHGVATVLIDCNEIGTVATPELWYVKLMQQVVKDLSLESECQRFLVPWENSTPRQQWHSLLEYILTHHSPGNIVIFIDEVEQIKKLPFLTNEFFIGIRSCCNRRATEEILRRLTFCLIGSVLPSELISDPDLTSYNIAKDIQLTDFTLGQVLRVWNNHPNLERSIPESVFARVIHWTGGHPYLSQFLCYKIANVNGIVSPTDVDLLCEEWFLKPDARQTNPHLANLKDRMLKTDPAIDTDSLLDLYGKVVSGMAIAADRNNALVDRLLLYGIVRVHEGHLKVSNPIYERVFDKNWVKAHTSSAERERQTEAANRAKGKTIKSALVVLGIISVFLVWAVNSYEREKTTSELLRKEKAKSDNSYAREKTTSELLRKEKAKSDNSKARAYSSYMSQIQQAWISNPRDVDYVEALLDQTKQDPERGWEWTYWDGLARRYRANSKGHTGPIYSIAFNNDHTLLVTGSYDKTAKIWDTKTGECKQTLTVNGDQVYAVAFAHEHDWVATGSADGVQRIWEVNPKKLSEPAQKDPKKFKISLGSQILTMAFSPHDDKWLAAGSVGGQVILWNPKTGVRKSLIGHTGRVTSVAFSPDGDQLVSAGYDGTARVWDLRDLTDEMPKVQKILRSKDGLVCSAAFSHDGNIIVMANRDGNTTLWDVKTGAQRRVLPGHSERVAATAFTPDDNLFTASRDGTVSFWQTRIPAPSKPPHVLNVEKGSLFAIAVSQDGKLLATAGYDHTARIWDVKGKLLKLSLILDGRSHGGKREDTAKEDHGIVRSDPVTGPYLLPLTIEHREVKVHISAFSDDGTRVVAASPDGTGAIFDAQNRTLLKRLHGHPGAGFAAVFSHDGERVITVSPGGLAFIWDVKSGKQLNKLEREQPISDNDSGSLYSVAFSNDNNKVIIGSRDGWLRLYDSNTGNKSKTLYPLKTQHPYTRIVVTVAFSPDNKQVIAGSDDLKRNIKVLDADTLKPQFDFDALDAGDISSDMSRKASQVHESLNDIAFSKDGKKAVVALTSGNIRIWDVYKRVILQRMKAYYGSPFAVGFAPDNNRVITGSSDGTVIIFDSDSGQPLLTFRTGGMPIAYVAFSANGDRVVAANYGAKVGTWMCNPPLIPVPNEKATSH